MEQNLRPLGQLISSLGYRILIHTSIDKKTIRDNLPVNEVIHIILFKHTKTHWYHLVYIHRCMVKKNSSTCMAPDDHSSRRSTPEELSSFPAQSLLKRHDDERSVVFLLQSACGRAEKKVRCNGNVKKKHEFYSDRWLHHVLSCNHRA